MYKRGMSTLIATVLIIGVTISAFGIVYTVVMPLIKENIESNRLCGDTKVMINTQKGYTCYDSSTGQVYLQVSRGPDNINISSLQLKVSGEGNSNSVNVIDGVKPVGLWHMDEGPGATEIIDSSGNGHKTMNIPYRVPGKLENALNFDGVDDYVSIPDSPSLDITNEITMSAWIKVKTALVNTRIVYKENAYGLAVRWDGYKFCYLGGIVYWTPSDAINVVDGEWHYIACTYNGIDLRLYVDGINTHLEPFSGIITTSDDALQISANNPERLNGTIDEVSIWNKSLSATDINNLYNSGNGQKSNLIEPNSLVGYWPLNEGSGISAADFSGNGNIGTLNNFKSVAKYTPSGKFGGAYEFDGEKDYINISYYDNLNITKNITIGAWIKAKSFNGWSNIFGSLYYYAIRLNGNIIYNVIHNGTVNFVIGSTLLTDRWYYIVLTYNGAIAKTYLDGVLDGNSSFGGEIESKAENRGIGADLRVQGLPTNSFFNGTIDEVSIYDRVLNADEIKNLYESYRIVDKVISPNGERTYVISASSLNLNNIDSASVAPIVKIGNKNRACSMMPDVQIPDC